jgi:hypothetical protein
MEELIGRAADDFDVIDICRDMQALLDRVDARDSLSASARWYLTSAFRKA